MNTDGGFPRDHDTDGGGASVDASDPDRPTSLDEDANAKVETDDTIVAVSTPRGAGARGVIRVSGPRAIPIVEAQFVADGTAASRTGTLDGIDWRLVTGRLRLGRSGVTAPAFVVVMRAPRSYTTEDQVELHLPGAPMLLDVVVELLVREGARPAEAGEFTRRAFLAGRIDLTQAEAVAAVIEARSEDERRAALSLLGGGLRHDVDKLADAVVVALTPLELGLDFSDQDIEIVEPEGFDRDLAELERRIDRLVDRRRTAGAVGARRRVVLTGPANAGKSSLFNRLVGDDRSLVSVLPGTTRDYLEGRLVIGDVEVTIVDTAGTGVARDELDDEAEKARSDQVGRADFVLEIRDGRTVVDGNPEGGNDTFVASAVDDDDDDDDASVAADRHPGFHVFTHGDLVPPSARPARGSDRHVDGDVDSNPSDVDSSVNDAAALWVSTVTGEGLDDLIGRLEHELVELTGASPAFLRLHRRHQDGLLAARDAIVRAREGLSMQAGDELVAADLRDALQALRGITGVEYEEEVLDRIMRDFCIGK